MAAPKIDRETIGRINDPTHPIQRLDIIDQIAEKENGTIALTLVAAGKLEGDAKSQARLVEKVGSYLHYVASPDFRAKFGTPAPGKTSIVVKLHQGGAPEIRILLARLSKWAGASGVSVVLEIPEA